MSIISKLLKPLGEKMIATGYEENAMRAYQDYSKFLEEIKDDWKRAKIKQLLNEDYKLGKLGNDEKIMLEHQKQNAIELKEKLAKDHNNGYVWLTVRPKPKTDFQKFKSKCEKFFERNMFKTGSMYVYEQSGTTEETCGEGFHAHFLLKRNLDYKPCLAKKNSYNTFKDICNINAFDWKNIGEDYSKDKREYILGTKTGDGKDAKQAMDPIFRERNGLKKFYER